jgi:hypothetical protein
VSILFSVFLSRWKPRLKISETISVNDAGVPTITVINMSYFNASVENRAELHYLRAGEAGEHVKIIKLLRNDPLVIESRRSGTNIHRDEFVFWLSESKNTVVSELTDGNYDRIRFRIYSKDSFSNFGSVHQQYFDKESIKDLEQK